MPSGLKRFGPALSDAAIIAGSIKREPIDKATLAFFNGMKRLLFPSVKHIVGVIDFQKISKLKKAWLGHINQVQPQVVDIIEEINKRARVKNRDDYKTLIKRDMAQWIGGNGRFWKAARGLLVGFRGCVDGGLTDEAIAGYDAKFGRSLAGDDEIVFLDKDKRWCLRPNAVKKILLDQGVKGGASLLGLIEHLGCGRRDQMRRNLQADNEIARLFGDVISNISSLEPEFEGGGKKAAKALRKMLRMWKETDAKTGVTRMVEDKGVWIGILAKIAQRQAYREMRDLKRTIIPVELYDKRDGNVFVGIDNYRVLTHKLVSENGGYTDDVLEELVDEGLIFSLKHEVSKLDGLLSKRLSLKVKKGARTFENLQENWLSTREKFTDVTGELWHLFESDSKDKDVLSFKALVLRFVKLSFQQVSHDFEALDSDIKEVLKRRQIHHLFQMLAYAWTLDTFSEKGNPPGTAHLEKYGVARSGEFGVKKYMGLAQGEIDEPRAIEMLTTREVLLHSKLIEKEEPVIYFWQLDTDRGDIPPISGTEGAAVRRDIEELLKLWPYIVIGDIVPVIQIISKDHDGVSKLALSSILEFEDLNVYAQIEGGLPELVPAANSKDEVVLIPAMDIIDLGLKTKGNLIRFREELRELADELSNKAIQRRLR